MNLYVTLYVVIKIKEKEDAYFFIRVYVNFWGMKYPFGSNWFFLSEGIIEIIKDRN